jgi:hypothetical protein
VVVSINPTTCDVTVTATGLLPGDSVNVMDSVSTGSLGFGSGSLYTSTYYQDYGPLPAGTITSWIVSPTGAVIATGQTLIDTCTPSIR